MLLRRLTRPANKVPVLTCLLAATTLLAGSWQANAQATSYARLMGTRSSPEGMVRLGGHTPRKVTDGTAIRLDHYDPQQKLRLAIFVTPRDLAGQEKLIAELQDKKSPMFHQWLTAAEWNARFGPLVEDEQAVVDWAKSQGLTVTNRFDNRMIVDVEAESGTIEKALGVTINKYQVGDEVDFSNDRDPLIPARLSGIIGGVFGLTSIERVHPANSGHSEARRPDYVPGPMYSTRVSGRGEGDPTKAPWAHESGIGRDAAHVQAEAVSPGTPENSPNANNDLGGINPENLYNSQGYDLGGLMGVSRCCNVHNDTNGSPADTSIGLVTFANFNYPDYTTFTTYYGMAWLIDAYSIDGAGTTATTECQIDVTDPGGSCPGPGMDDEADLDTEWSTAFANSYGSSNDTAHVYVYEGTVNYFSNWFDVWNYALSDGHAHVFSTSWGWGEEGQQSGDPGWMTGTVAGDAHYVFNALVAQGNTLIAAAGDQGSTEGCTTTVQLIWPSDDPDFLAAGGTSLSLNQDGSFGSEVAWTGGSTLKNCQTNGGGGGGGVSHYFTAPSWQSGLTYEEYYNNVQYSVSGQGYRMAPDMSLNATGNFQWYYCTTPACSKASNPNGWATVGGTSIVAPELAGFFVQVNSYLNAIGHICGSAGTSRCEPIGNPDPILYEIGEHAGATNYEQHYPFYDTNSGCVTNYITANYSDITYFCATPGYDLATGWGSANLMQLAWAINWWTIPAYGSPSVSFTGPAKNTWYNTNQTVNWTVADGTFSGSTTPAPGVAGFTQGWDSLPADPTSEPNGGTGNAFYSGPEYPLGTSGCLAFSANGCSGGAGQGCHTVEVRAWDNQGYANTYTYGPLCYDTVAPTISAGYSPAADINGWNNSAVTITLNANDPGGSNASGIATTYYGVNSLECNSSQLGNCTVYTGPFTLTAQGTYLFNFFTVDKAGNVSTETYTNVQIDLTAPVTTATLSGDLQGGNYYSKVSVTLSATDAGGSGLGATYYTVDGGAQTTYSGSAIVVSAVGSHTLQYWSVDGAFNVEAKHTFAFTIAPDTATTLSSPTASSTLGGPAVTFSWGSAVGSNGYFLHLGSTGVGSDNLLNSAEITGTSLTVEGLPVNGETVYARLFTDYNGNHVYRDYTFTAAQQATLSAPTAGGTLIGPNVIFSWSTATGSVNGYFLHVGSTGVGSENIYNSTELATTSKTLNGMPVNGETIYVRLFTDYNGHHVYQDYQFTAAQQGVLNSPTPSTTLSGPSVKFGWVAGTGLANGYFLHIGSTGVGSDNLLNSSEYSAIATSVTVNNLPVNGETIYVRLFTDYNGTHVYQDYTYTAAAQATLLGPTAGSGLVGPKVTFRWTAATGTVNGYFVHIGSTGVGSDNLLNSAEYTTATTSVTVSDLPANGTAIYVRVFTDYNGTHLYQDYQFTAATAATLVTPQNGSTLTGSTATFTWSAATGIINGYFLHVGSTGVGSENLLNSTEYSTGTTSATVNNLPTTGGTIYVRVFTDYGGIHVYRDYTFTAAN